jgi:hypothetical protein
VHEWIDVAALLKVLAVGLAAGAGLVAVFSLGLVGLSARAGTLTAGGIRQGPRAGGLLLAVACFLAVTAGIALGLWTILT